ncbi:hypothetical protein [Streptomyces virginiae]|uniref:hypothetical protein n=1 Tax=Streptomyces virginiae TaxID=1961 RepID=UPI00345604CC
MPENEYSLLAPVIILAALVIRTALTELRQPGSARHQWAFATSPAAMAAGATVAAAITVIGVSRIGWAAAAWALLAGALTAHLTCRNTPPLARATPMGKEPAMTERRTGMILAAVGGPLTVAGTAMCFLPGPGSPVLVIGLAVLFTGLAMAAAGRR